MRRVIRIFSSLKLAVCVLIGLVASLTTATFLESIYDTPTAQYYVYQALWFHGLLTLLGINIFTVAAVRFPWKRSQIPFVLAHIGILTLLFGSWVTYRQGIDGSLRISEGETGSVVRLPNSQLHVVDGDKAWRMPVDWIPPGVKFKTRSTRDYNIPYDIVIDDFYSHADAEYSFEADPAGRYPALKFRVAGGPMRISQDFWLWAGDPSFAMMQAGPAFFALVPDGMIAPPPTPGRPSMLIFATKEGFSYQAVSSAGKKTAGRISTADLQKGPREINPDWKKVSLTFLEWIPVARPVANYSLAKTVYGPTAPSSAIHIRAEGGTEKDSAMWLGLGDRVILRVGNKQVNVTYSPEQIILPFSVRLNRFSVGHNPGTRDPSAYSSNVTVNGKSGTRDAEISMNEPLEEAGITLYQASYEDAQPRPTISILSVNRDPGRSAKYIGSLLIVLGAILLFASKYRLQTRAAARAVSASGSGVVKRESQS